MRSKQEMFQLPHPDGYDPLCGDDGFQDLDPASTVMKSHSLARNSIPLDDSDPNYPPSADQP